MVKQLELSLMPGYEIHKKSYRAIRHEVVRQKQDINSNEVHHPNGKIQQIERVLTENNHHVLELFAGRGNLTNIYKKYGTVESYDKTHLKTGDSYLQFHNLIANKKNYTVIDVDPYGFPNRFFPDLFLLIKNGYLFLTFPKPYVNILNGITQTHLTAYFGRSNPTKDEVIEKIATYGICHWRKVQLIDSIDQKSVWRFAFSVERVKSTEYTGVKNR